MIERITTMTTADHCRVGTSETLATKARRPYRADWRVGRNTLMGRQQLICRISSPYFAL